MDSSLARSGVDSPAAVSGVFSDTERTSTIGTNANNATRTSTAAESLQGLVDSGTMVLRAEREASCWRPPEVTGNG